MKQANTQSVRVFAGKQNAVVRVAVPSTSVPRVSVGSFYCCCGDGNQPK